MNRWELRIGGIINMGMGVIGLGMVLQYSDVLRLDAMMVLGYVCGAAVATGVIILLKGAP